MSFNQVQNNNKTKLDTVKIVEQYLDSVKI
jgi:hypothetical protein